MGALNIVLITIDCLRFDRIDHGASGPVKRAITPNIQRLAERGVSFVQASTAGCWTQAAFPALLTSTYGSMYNGCLGLLSTKRPNLVDILRRHGYYAAAVQTSPLLGRDYAYDRAFDAFVELAPDRGELGWYRRKGMQRLLRLPLFHKLLRPWGVDTRPVPAYASAREVSDRALEIVRSSPKPFFLWVHYMDAHWPCYEESRLPTPDRIARAWRDRRLMYLASPGQGSHHPGDAHLHRFTAMYDRAISRIDRQVGHLLDSLAAKEVETLFVLTADHGEEFFEHGKFGHSGGSLYEEIVHVPLIVVWPAGPQGIGLEGPVSLIDVAPTLLDLVGIPKPEEMLGYSLLPSIRQPPKGAQSHHPIIVEGRWQPDVHRVALRVDGYKFIIDLRYPDQYELYDLAKDPEERRNLNGQAPERTTCFQDLLSQHLARVRATEEGTDPPPEVDGEVIGRLRALGYVDWP